MQQVQREEGSTLTGIIDVLRLLAAIEQRLARLETQFTNDQHRKYVISEQASSLLPNVHLMKRFSDEARLSFIKELTLRERQVAQLAVDCLSNREIAAELSIGAGTVANLLTNIYGKLYMCGVFGNRAVDRIELVRFLGDFLTADELKRDSH